MVDGIANQPASKATARAAVVPVQSTAPARPATPPATPAAGRDAAQTGSLARALANSAPVDMERVQRIKRAIAEGKFPILPATIADRMLALRLAWSPNREAPHDPA